MRHDDVRGPSAPPHPPKHGLVPALVASVRLPLDLLVLVGYTVREAPQLVQDLRSAVNDVARLIHHGEQEGALQELLDELARAARADNAGALAHLLRSAGDLAEARAEVERRRLPSGREAAPKDLTRR